jgi:hypothetical protein
MNPIINSKGDESSIFNNNNTNQMGAAIKDFSFEKEGGVNTQNVYNFNELSSIALN